MDRGDGRVVGQQERGCIVGIADAAGRVEAWREREADRLERDLGGHNARRGEQRDNPGPWLAADPFEAEPRDPAVLPEHGCNVRHRPDHGKVGEVRGRFRDGDPGQAIQQQRGDLEGDARTRQPRVRVPGVGTMRVDDRECRRPLGGYRW